MQSIYQADINFPTNDAQNYAGATKDGSIRLIELPIPSLLRYDEYEVYYKRAFFFDQGLRKRDAGTFQADRLRPGRTT